MLSVLVGPVAEDGELGEYCIGVDHVAMPIVGGLDVVDESPKPRKLFLA